MILERLEVRGFSTAFRSTTAELELGDLPAGVYAWCGPNGAGKTTAMESVVAALYREFPSYGYAAIKHVAPGVRDASIKVVVRLGDRRVRLRLQCDPAFSGGRGKTEHYVDTWHTLGKWVAWSGPLVGDTAVRIADLFPTRELFLAGPYAAQRGAGSFWQLELTEKKRLFVELLGHGKLQLLHAAAAQKNKTTGVDLEVLQTRYDQVRGLVAQREDLERLLELSRETLAELVSGAEAHQMVVTEARRAAEDARTALARALEAAQGIETRRGEAGARVARAHQELVVADRDLNDARKGAGPPPATDPEAGYAQAREATAAATRARDVAQRALDAATQAAREAERDSDVRTAYIQQQQAALDGAQRNARLDGVDLSLELCRACPLTERARTAATEAVQIAPDLVSAESALEVAAGVLEDARRRARRQAQELARLVDLRELAANAEQLALDRATEERKRADARRRVEELERLVADKQFATRQAIEDLEQLPPAPEHDDLQEAVAMAAAALEQFVQQQRVVDDARRESERDVARLEGQLETVVLQIAGADVEELGRQLAVLQRRRRGWTTLELGLGPNGVQALEIDAAGPEVSQIANDLLLACYGPRFQLRLETTRPLKTKEGTAEVFECAVIDAEADRTAHAGSGGEMVIVEEALRLGLAIYSTRQSGKECLTLFRDEAAGALDQWPGRDSAGRYLEMLRAARETGGFHHVHFIAHQPALFEAADGRFVFGGGAVRFEE